MTVSDEVGGTGIKMETEQFGTCRLDRAHQSAHPIFDSESLKPMIVKSGAQ